MENMYGRKQNPHQKDSYMPDTDRKRLWQNTFGSEPLPDTVPDAAERFAGSLGLDLDLTPADLQAAINQADED